MVAKVIGKEDATMDGNGPMVETLAQDRSPLDREKCNMNVPTAIRERVLRWAGHVARMDCSEVCAKALRCGEVATTPFTRSGQGQVGWSAPKTTQHFQMPDVQWGMLELRLEIDLECTY